MDEVPGEPVVKVRPKSTHRKQRTAAPDRTKLAPAQNRSRARHEAILNAVERLLRSANIEDLSHSDIAQEAGMSKPSVHYHFPTIASLQRELGKRYSDEIAAITTRHNRAAVQDGSRSWHEVLREASAVARDYLNDNRPACEALYGPMLHRENRLASMSYNRNDALALLSFVRRWYELPERSDLEEAFLYNGEIIDVFWSTSYLRYGRIDDHAFDTSLLASLGYLRNFIPDILPRRRQA